MGRRVWLLAGAGAAAAALLIAGVALAGDGENGAGTGLLDRVAQKLGIERSQLDQAIKDARTDQIDEAVAAGRLTEEQGDRLKERLESLPAERALAPRFHRGGHGPGHGLGLHLGAAKAELADFLGIGEEQLREELRADGATLATVAEAHGKSREELKSFLQSQAEEALAMAVSNGRITQERADQILAGLGERLDAMIDGEFRKPGGPWRGAPDNETEPAESSIS